MSVIETIKTAYRSLVANKLRTILTILGIIIGITSVISLVGIGKGAQKTIEGSVSSFGSNVITITPGRPTGSTAFSLDFSAKFSDTDYEALVNSNKQFVSEYAAATQSTYKTNYQNNVKILAIIGQKGNFAKIRNFNIQKGRELNAQDEISNAKVAVIGPDLIDSLFNGQNAIGEKIKINNIPFTVVGITEPKGSNGFVNTDESVLIPLSSMQKYLTGNSDLRNIIAQAKNPDQVEAAKAEIATILRKSRGLKTTETNDFSVRDSGEFLTILNQITGVFTIFLTAIAAISLLVGGIGIMNIMFVSVSERTKEIGLRKALGARNRDILLQFLIEAVMVTLLGGIIGVGLGVGISALISAIANFESVITIESILLALGVSASIGLIFGIYPASKASKLNPIDALRFE
ncbi:MAG: ABC transporter permease [bacterium]